MIRRIDPDDISAIQISKDEIVRLYKNIIKTYITNGLGDMGVKPLWAPEEEDLQRTDDDIIKGLTPPMLQLILLSKYPRCFVHKDLISSFVRTYIPSAGLDQQVRHLGTQCYWNILNRGSSVPESNEQVPSGYHYLVSIETANPLAFKAFYKRAGRIAAKSFDALKMVYGNRCATCGMEEGRIDPRTNKKVVLQQGHMDPSKRLTLDNTIPQCEYCNETSRDNFVFNSYGRIIAINNPRFILNSTKYVRLEMYKCLKAEFDK